MSQVIVRCDDAGSSEGAADAIYRCVTEGIGRNASVMAPTAHVGYAADRLVPIQDRISVGLHVTLTSEWDDVRWGPVLPTDQVPSLVLPDGTFPATGHDLAARANTVEVEAEVRAQLARLRSLGFRVDYLDEHMGVGWIPGFREVFHRIAAEEGLILADQFIYGQGVDTLDWSSVAAYASAGHPAPSVLVFHPLPDFDPVARQFTFGGRMPGEILRERAQERRTLTDPRLTGLVQKGLFEPMSYVEAARA